jgi:hypothetical protein
MAEGRSWEEVDEMTLPQVLVLNRQYRKVPPLRVSLAAIAQALGVRFPSSDDEPAAPRGRDEVGPELAFAFMPEFEGQQ